MLHRCTFTPMYTSANTLAAGCVHTCIRLYVCICIHMHMDAYVCLWYNLTRWGVVARIFYLYIRVHMYAYTYVYGYIYMCILCSECYMHFTGVLSTSAWVGEYVTWVCFYTSVHICEHTPCRLYTYVYKYICVYMDANAFGCVCASMILLDTLRRCC